MRYTKYGILFGLIVVTVGVGMTLIYGYRPQPERIMKPSFFDKTEDIGAVVIKRFYAPIEAEKVVFFGVEPAYAWSEGLIRGFIDAAKANGREFKRVLVEEQLNDGVKNAVKTAIPNTFEVAANTDMMSGLADAIAAGEAAGERTLVVVPNIYSSHLIPQSPINRLEQAMKREYPYFAVTTTVLALEPVEEKNLNPICVGTERDAAGTVDLGCTMISAGRHYYRKRPLDNEPNARKRFTAIMTSLKEKDYVLLVRQPDAN